MNRPIHAVPLVFVALVAACQGEPTSSPNLPIELHLTIVSGDAQAGDPNVELPLPLVAAVVDSRGKPIPEQLVNFRVVTGGGSVFGGSAISDKLGIVQDYWTLGPGGQQVLEVRAVNPTTGEKFTYATFTAVFKDPDGDGYTVQQGDCNEGDPAINPAADDDPDPTFADTNCDNVDGTAATAVFVAPTGTDNGSCGDLVSPCATISHGIQRAVALTRAHVFIAVGTYTESVRLSSGVSLYGGYSSAFDTRSLLNRAVINGAALYQTTALMYTVLGENLTQATSVVALVIQAPDASGRHGDGSGRHVSGLLLANIAAGLVTFSHSQVIVGDATGGLAGANGISATQTRAASGYGGANAGQVTFCDDATRPAGGAGGISNSGHGGTGGRGGKADTNCDLFSLNFFATAGTSGGSGFSSGFLTDGAPGGGGGACGVPGSGGLGASLHGSHGSGGSAWLVVPGVVRVGDGTPGQLGQPGSSGGGGGGSGGCDNSGNSFGAGGGGGGAGGERALAVGSGGKGGGAAIGIYLLTASATVNDVDIVRGKGGAGGGGGAGGAGQPGGLGGPGGAGNGGSVPGGRGGDGGLGGHSGAGGGGAGGFSTGILLAKGSTVSQSGVTQTGGVGGAGGAGGSRAVDGTFGGNGPAGGLTPLLVIP